MASQQKYTILALFAVILIDALGWGIAFPVLAPIILNNTSHIFSAALGIGARNFLYELALGIYCLFMFVMSPILGSLSDKYGRKTILIVSMSGNFLGFLISGLAISFHSFAWILIGRAIAGGTAGSLPIAQAAMIDISTDAQKAARLGLVVLANVSGFAIGPVIGGFFMDPAIFGTRISYEVPFLISAAMGLIGALLVIFCFQETFQGNRKLKIHILTSFVNIRDAFTNTKTLFYCSILLCFLFGWGMFFSTMPVFLTERLGWQGASLGYFITCIAVIFAIIVLFVMPRVNAKFALSKIVRTGLIALSICAILFPTIHYSIFAWLLILLTIAVPFSYVGTVTLLSMQVNAQKQGEIMGVAGCIFAFTWGVGPILAGFVLKAGLAAPYVFAAAFFIAALFVLRGQKLSQKKNVVLKAEVEGL